jgi:transcriptional regulator with XRE-family HTH domain
MIAATSWFQKLEFRRVQLGMSRATVANRSGVSLPTVVRILSGKEQNPRLCNVDAIARALGVDISISLNDRQSVQEFRKSQAETKAKKLIGMVQGNMALESQAVDQSTVAGMIDQTTSELLAGSRRKLWE